MFTSFPDGFLGFYTTVSGPTGVPDGLEVFEARGNVQGLARHERLNDQVLAGRISPMSVLPLRFRTAQYYAVLARAAHRPRSFRLVYANSTYALYRLPSAA